MKLIVATVGALACASLLGMLWAPASLRVLSADSDSSVSGECGAPLRAGGAHAYYEALASRPECVAAFSLRQPASLKHLQGAFGNGVWDYVYPDPDYPDGPDAARLTFGGSLVPRNQLLHAYAATEGSYVWIVDAYWPPEMQQNIASGARNINHKMLNIRDGRGIWFEPGHVYATSGLARGQIGQYKARLYYGGLGHPAGLIRDNPVAPPGQGATSVWPDRGTSSLKSTANTWNRFIIQVDLDLPGTAFAEWAQEYTKGQPIATWDIQSSTPNPEGGTTTIRLAQDHQLYYAVRARRSDMSRVTIGGHSDDALNGTWLAKRDEHDPRVFTIPVVGRGGSGGTTSMHYHRLSWWVLDENRDAVRILYRVPMVIRDNLSKGDDWTKVDGKGGVARWDIELNTSTSFQDHAAGLYMTTAPTIERQTVITTPEPHGYRVGDRLAFRFSDVVPLPSDRQNAIFRVVEVVSPTRVRIDWPVTAASQLNASGPAAGSYGFVAKTFRAYWRNWVLLKNLDLVETDRTIFARPLR